MSASGEIYFIGEKDLRTKEITSYFKVGLVRENAENADRNSVDSFTSIVKKIELGQEKKEYLHGFSLELRRVNAEATWSKMKAESKIKVTCGTHAGIDGVIKWARSEKVAESLDKKALKLSHPELVAEFTTAGDVVKAVIVDPKKGY